MNNIFLQRAAFLLSIGAITSVVNGLPAQAEMADTGLTQSVATENFVDSNTKLASEVAPISSDVAATPTPESVELNSTPLSEQQSNQSVKNQPVPGTSQTSAASLENQPVNNRATATKSDSSTVSQAELDPGRSTRSGSSYVGIGGNIGIGGDTALGDFGFAIMSKIGLTRNFSFRPAAIISGDADFLLPITFDFPIQAEPFDRISFAPYVGAGVLITTSEGSNIGALVTGGVDVPITDKFTATAGLNLGFNSDSVGVGVMLGVGYNFGAGFEF